VDPKGDIEAVKKRQISALAGNRSSNRGTFSVVIMPAKLQTFLTIISTGTQFQRHTAVNYRIWINELRIAIFVKEFENSESNVSSQC
jgi:hypothetical protein